jgi:hypothetical protein
MGKNGSYCPIQALATTKKPLTLRINDGMYGTQNTIGL